MSAGTGRHCLVLGAGIVGACCAWRLVEAGFRVTLADRGLPGQATSFGNAAGISPSQVVPFSYPGVWKKVPGWLRDPLGPLTIRWRDLPWTGPWLWRFLRAGTAEGVQRASRAQAALMHRVPGDWDELLAATGLQDLLRPRGAITVYERPEQLETDRWIYELETELGFPWKLLDPDELHDLAPALRLDGGAALYLPSWRHTVNPGRLGAAIADDAIARGVHWLQDEALEVTARPDGVEARFASAGARTFDALVLAAGPWSNRFAARLDHAVPMTPKRGYHTTIADSGVSLDLPVISGTRSFVITPLETGLRLAGTAEFARLDAAPDYRRAKALVGHARRYLPGLTATGVTEWMGQRPMMADSVPVISVSPRHRNVFYAFGHGHYGLTQGPTTARLITALMRGEPPALDLAPYRIDRFG